MSYSSKKPQLSLPPEFGQFHSELLQVDILRAELKQQKRQDQITYQFLKKLISTS